jgi:DNA-binding NarL/FixJ family response regulator
VVVNSMMQGGVAPCDAGRLAVLIVDALSLRRAGFISIVEQWAQVSELDIEGISPAELELTALQPRAVAMVILNIGGTSVVDPQVRRSAETITELFPRKPCVVISDRPESEEAVAAAQLSMAAFLSTSMMSEAIENVLTFVLGGGTYFPREALLRMAPAEPQKTGSGKLTRRQLDVLERLRLGDTNKRIARDLRMQESTVKVHVRQIMTKLGAANRTQAALLASSVVDGATEAAVEDESIDPGDAKAS